MTGRALLASTGTALVLAAGPSLAQLRVLKPGAQVATTVGTTPEYPLAAFHNSVSAGAASVAQPQLAPAPGRFVVSLVDPGKGGGPFVASSPFTVHYTVGGSATAGSDYFALPGQVTIPAGSSSAEILVYAVQDGLFEGSETVTVTLTDAAPTATTFVSRSATVTILDGDARVTVAASTPVAEEAGPKPGAFTVTREGPTADALAVSYAVAGSATPATDYVPLPGTVTIPAGATTAVVTVKPVPDAVSDDGETVILTLKPGPRYAVGSALAATVTIRDVTVAFDRMTTTGTGGTVTLPEAGATIAKLGGKFADVVFGRTGDASAPLGVPLSLSGSAVRGVDYDIGASTVTFAAGASTVSARIAARPDVGAGGGAKTVTVSLAPGKDYAVSSRSGATLTLDPSIPPAVTLVSLSAPSVPGGTSAKGTVQIEAAAPGGGAAVSLSSSTPAATVPSPVTVQAGKTEATFEIRTTPVSLDVPVTIRAGLGQAGGPASVVLTVQAPALASVSFAPVSVAGAVSVTVPVAGLPPAIAKPTTTVALSAAFGTKTGALGAQPAAPSTPPATLPASLSIPPGQLSATFDVATVPVANDAVLTVTAGMGGVSKSGALTIKGPTVASLSASPAALTGGGASTVTYTLSSPAPAPGVSIQLATNPPLRGPGSTVLGAGDSTGFFTLATDAVSTATPVVVSATLNGVTTTTTLTVNPPSPTALAFAPSFVVAGGTSLGTVTLDAPAPGGGISLPLASNSIAATVPASVSVAPGQKTATFVAKAAQVGSDATVTISVGRSGANRTADLVVSPPVSVASLTLAPASATGGLEVVTGTVTLSQPVPGSAAAGAPGSAGVVDGSSRTVVVGEQPIAPSVTISASSLVLLSVPASNGNLKQIGLGSTTTAAVPPPSLVLALSPGQTTATFQARALPTATDQGQTVTATASGPGIAGSATAPLTVLAPVLSSVSVSPSPVLGGTFVTAQFVLSGPAPVAGLTASVVSSSPVAQPPVIGPLRGASPIISIPTSVVTADTPVTLTVTVGGVTKTATFTVSPTGIPGQQPLTLP